MKSKKKVFLSLGSNVGRRLAYLKKAAAAIGRLPGTRVKKLSSVYETSPVGPRQRDYLNAVLQMDTSLDPLRLMMRLRSLEKELGRKKRRRWGPREIDVDMIFYGSIKLDKTELRLPHPRWRERKFVLWPLSELAPRLKDPKSGLTVRQWREKLTDPDQWIRVYPKALIREAGRNFRRKKP